MSGSSAQEAALLILLVRPRRSFAAPSLSRELPADAGVPVGEDRRLASGQPEGVHDFGEDIMASDREHEHGDLDGDGVPVADRVLPDELPAGKSSGRCCVPGLRGVERIVLPHQLQLFVRGHELVRS